MRTICTTIGIAIITIVASCEEPAPVKEAPRVVDTLGLDTVEMGQDTSLPIYVDEENETEEDSIVK